MQPACLGPFSFTRSTVFNPFPWYPSGSNQNAASETSVPSKLPRLSHTAFQRLPQRLGPAPWEPCGCGCPLPRCHCHLAAPHSARLLAPRCYLIS